MLKTIKSTEKAKHSSLDDFGILTLPQCEQTEEKNQVNEIVQNDLISRTFIYKTSNLIL